MFSNCIWELKVKEKSPLVEKYVTKNRRKYDNCNLCMEEKLKIIEFKDVDGLINGNNKIISNCPFEKCERAIFLESVKDVKTCHA